MIFFMASWPQWTALLCNGTKKKKNQRVLAFFFFYIQLCGILIYVVVCALSSWERQSGVPLNQGDPAKSH